MICLNVWTRGIADLKKNTKMDFMYNQKSCNSEISLFTFKQITRLSDFHLNSWKTPGVGGGGGTLVLLVIVSVIDLCHTLYLCTYLKVSVNQHAL